MLPETFFRSKQPLFFNNANFSKNFINLKSKNFLIRMVII